MRAAFAIPAVVLGALLSPWRAAAAGQAETALPLTAEQVAEQMSRMDSWRSATLERYTVTRKYVLDNQRFHKHAEMTVRMTYTYPGKKEFEVLSETGSGWVRKRVLRKLVETEAEAAGREAQKVKIVPENYEFQLVGTDTQDGRPCYVIEIQPKEKSKILIRGRIWVDSQDFAITRIEGSPAELPSFWTRKVHFVHLYKKAGPFWLPASNHADTDVRIFGRTEVAVDYFDYVINETRPAEKGVAVAEGEAQ